MMPSKSVKAILAVIVFAYSFFNFFYNLDVESFYCDEVVYSLAGLEYLQGNFTRNLEHPFLGKYLMGLSLQLLGRSDFSARLPSALFGFLTGVIIFIFARKVTAFTGGLTAVCLWSTSPIVLWASRRAILDAPSVFFFALSWYAFWRFFETEETRYALLGGVSLGLAAATKLLTAILAPILVLYLGLVNLREGSVPRWSFLSKMILAFLAALLLFLLIYAPVLDRLGSVLQTMNEHWSWEQRHGHREVINGVIYDKQPWWTYLYWYWRGYPPYLPNYSPGVLALLGLGICFALLRRGKLNLFLLLSLLLPFAYLSFYLSFKMFRYAAIFEPSLAILAVSFISAMSTYFKRLKGQGYVRWAFALFIAGAILYSMIQTSWDIYSQQENRYRAVADYLLPRLKGDEIVFVWGYTNAMRWYLGDGIEIAGGFNSSSFEGDYREADYIVVDPLMPSKWPDDPLNTYLQSNKAAYNEQAIGGFRLYVRRRYVECEISRFRTAKDSTCIATTGVVALHKSVVIWSEIS